MKPLAVLVFLACSLLAAAPAPAQVPPGGGPPEVSSEQVGRGDDFAEQGLAAFGEGRREEAFDLFEKSLEANPTVLTPTKTKASDRLVAVGRKLVEEGKPEEALAVMTYALRLNLYGPDAPYEMAVAEFAIANRDHRMEHVERAKELLQETVRRDPTHGRAFLLWGTIGLSTGQYEAAVQGFRGALDRATRIRDARAGLAQALFFLGVRGASDPAVNSDSLLPVFKEAVDLFETMKDDPGYPDAMRENFRDLWIKSLVNLAATHQKAEELAAAEAILKRLVEIEPENHLHFFNLGLYYGQVLKYDEALENYRRALDLAGTPDPDDWGEDPPRNPWIAPYPMMGYIYSQRDEPELAEKYLSAFVRLNPTNLRGQYQLGKHYERVGRDADAVGPFMRCVEIDPTDVASIRELSLCLRKTGRTVEADQWLALYEAIEEPEGRAGAGYPEGERPAPGKR